MRIAASVGVGLLLLASLAGCAPVESHAPSIPRGVWFRSTGIEANERVRKAAESHPIRVLFTQQDDGLIMIADGPVNGYTVPVTVQGGTIRPDRTRHGGVTTVACAVVDDPRCIVDRWVGTWADRPLQFSASGNRLQLRHGALVISLSAAEAPKE